MSDGQGEVYAQMREGPPLAYQATGGEHWQTGGGWGYQPVNAAAMAMRLRVRARQLQSDANDLAALGMGKGRYPEWTDEMASLARRMAKWAGEIGNETANYSALPKSSLAPCGVVD